MKILLVSLNYFPEQTGIGKFQGETAAWLAGRGHAVRAIAAPPYYPSWKIGKGYSGWRYQSETIAGIRIYRAPLYVPSSPCGWRRMIHLLSFALSSAPLILIQALFWRPDVILATAPPLLVAPAVLAAARLSGAHACLHIHNFEIDAAFHLGLLKHSFGFRLALGLERRLLGAFPVVSTISRRMRARLIEKGVGEDRSFLIPNWADIGAFAPSQGPGAWPVRLKNNPRDIVALYAGNLGCKQGIETIIEAARLLHGAAHIRFALCGDGAARRKIEKAAANLQNIVFLPVQDAHAFVHLMIAADIHLLPQKAEAADLVMPSKLGNILASGRPVIAGARQDTQLHDAVQGCGIAVPPGNAEAFAEAIAKLAADPALRAEMGAKGRQRACEEWSRNGILSRLERIMADRSALPEAAAEPVLNPPV